jgi:UDP-N-acetylglucosamine 3-dehydrogenase
MNVLLIGLGRWGEKHVRVLRELGVDLWVADVSADRRAWAAERGVAPSQAVADFRDALEVVDAVSIVTPADSHTAIAEISLAAGRHCFIEKPLAMTVAEGRALAAAADEAGCVLQVGHIFRFHPVTAALRDALSKQRVGAVRFATGRFAGFKRPRTDVGVTHTDAIHYFDLFAYLFGQPATSVVAVQHDHLGRGLDDLSVTAVRYGEVTAIVEADYFVPGTHRQCVIVGDRGALVADYGAGTVAFHPGEHVKLDGVWDVVGGAPESVAVTGDEPLRVELAAFLSACAGHGSNLVNAADGVHALEIVEAAALSARARREVSLSELHSEGASAVPAESSP